MTMHNIVLNEKELSHQYKEPLTQFFQKEKILFSERNFSTLLLYQKAHNWKIVVELKNQQENPVGMIGTSYDNKKVYMPFIEKSLLQNNIEPLLQALKTQFSIESLYPIQETTARYLSTISYKISYNINDGDYIMSKNILKTYPGRSFDGKRNLVHQFLNKGEASVKKLSTSTRDDAHEILHAWDRTHVETSSDYETTASHQGLDEYERLDIEGWITYSQGIPQAVIYGTPLTDSVFLIHCAKSAPHSEKGALAYLHQEVAKRLGDQYLSLNWEQDLGIMGIRRSKLQYEPERIMSKWHVHL